MIAAHPDGTPKYWIVTAIWLAVFLAALPFVFGRAGDVIVDSFYDLTVAMRLQSGEALYRDLAYLYGPVGAWVDWLWSSVFGLTVRAYLLICALLAAVELHMADRIARRYLAPPGRLFLLFGLMGVFTFHSELFGRLMPYSLSSFLAELGFLIFLDRWISARESANSNISAAAAGIAAGLLLHTKVEFGVVATIAICLDILFEQCIAASGSGRTAQRKGLIYGWALGVGLGFALLLPLGGDVFLYFSSADPRPYLTTDAGKKLAESAGSITSLKQLVQLAAFAVGSAAIMLLSAAVFWLISVRNIRTGLLVFSSGALVWLLWPFIGSWLDYTPLPGVILFLALCAAALLPDLQHNAANRTKLLLVLAAGGCLLRCLGALCPGLYGSFYLLPALVVSIALSGEWGRWLDFKQPHFSAQAMAFGFFVLSLWGAEANFQRFRVKNYSPSSALMPFATDKNRGQIIGDTLVFLSEKVRPGEYLAVMPQEPIISFALQAKPVFPDHNFIAHAVRGDSMAALALKFETRKPKFVVVSNRPYREGGLGPFGSNYAREIQALIDRDYTVVRKFGPSPFPADDAVAIWVSFPSYAITVYELKEQ
ncbi:MAG: hypothetical protein JW832_08460 [Deltaproteobacteria bacterium]|nr:hypothetical protein [Deltaproteobacteria bacterium]